MRPGRTSVAGIAGQWLSRGYLNRPDLMAESLISHPSSDEPGAHLYKTGDRARYLADGAIEFLGRMDHQLKSAVIGSSRGEIEAVLRQYPGIGQAVVTAEEDAKEKYAIASAIAKRLVAYVVADRIPGATTNELRDFSQTRLPGYMVPFVFMFLDSLPLNINGNVDRKALPAMDANRSGCRAKLLGSQDLCRADDRWDLVRSAQDR